MLRYALRDWKSDERTLYGHGRIPHLTSILAMQRLVSVGHAVRNNEPLGCIIQSTHLVAGTRKATLERNVVKVAAEYSEITRIKGKDQIEEVWEFLRDPEERDEWRALCREQAARREDKIWKGLAVRRRYRWCSLPRLQNRVNQALIEALAFSRLGNPVVRHTRVCISPETKDFWACDPTTFLKSREEFRPEHGTVRFTNEWTNEHDQVQFAKLYEPYDDPPELFNHFRHKKATDDDEQDTPSAPDALLLWLWSFEDVARPDP